ncbi:MAG: T9SS type A sorting domain-containing protein, partial [Bacteroidetes bacterium]|nr:T9SS type A sorting domain-containing protein [Bacteroidota bacterium]
KLAIDSKNGAPFTISNNSKLNANFRNILIETFASPHPAVIKASTISCLNTSGVPANCLITPYVGKRTSTGIEINDNAQVNVGLDLAAQTNTFNNMDKGVVNTRSGLKLYNNFFNNITYTGSGLGRCVVSTNNNSPSPEKLLVIGGTANAYQKNTFANSAFGIFATNNQDMSIIGNTFTNLGEAANMHYCIDADNQLDFNNNTINDCAWGLHASGNQGSKTFNAINNTFNTTIVTPKPNSTAISVENTALSGLNIPMLTVNSNTINSVLTGIKITNFTSPYVSQNKVSALSDLGSSNPGNGILMTTCPSQITLSNTVQGAGSSVTWQSGIRVESSVNSRVTYNSVENIGRGLFFGGNCLGTETAKNHMMNNYDGFLLNYGTTGYQLGSATACRATENKWEGTFTNHLYSYFSNGVNSQHYLYGPPVSTSFVGGSMYPTGIVSGASSTAPGYSAISYASCATLSGYRLTNPGADQWNEVADDQMAFAAFEETAKWMSKYDLYTMMKSDESFKTRTDLTNFSKDMSRTNIAKISDLNDMLTGNTLVIQSAETLLNSIVPANNVEKNYKDVFAALLTIRKEQALSAKQIASLKEIATQCPYEGGDAVYNARVILSTINETVAVTECELPVAQSKLANTSTINNHFDALTVLPNPGNGLFTVNTTVDDAKDIMVYDVMGKVVHSQTNIQDNTVKFDISGLPAGLYIVKLISNGTVHSQKIIKQ